MRLLLALFIAWPSVAFAYECTVVTDNTGQVVAPRRTQVWNQRCIPYFINRTGNLLAGPERRQLLKESFDVWSAPNCTDLTFLDVGYTNEVSGFDARSNSNQNVVWSVETEEEQASVFTNARQVAITETFYSVESGEIFNADLSINSIGFDFQDISDEVSCRVSANPPFDLRSILVHEVGHFIGFDHNQADIESTMLATADTCETIKRTLTNDDIQGVCDVYPVGQAEPATCFPPPTEYDDVGGADRFRMQCERALNPGGSGCSCRAERVRTQNSGGPVAWLFAVGVFLLLRRRRHAPTLR